MTNVAFLGLGIMGAPMAVTLVCAHDTRAERIDDGVTGDAPGCIWLARITDDDAVSVIPSYQRQVTLTEFILTTTGAGPFAE